MGEQERARAKRVDDWLAAGGTVLAATERAARSVAAAFHAARRAEGRTAWETPAIFSWDKWVERRWLERNLSGLVLMNPLQEQALWSRIIQESRIGRDLLQHGELARAAQQAYRRLADYAPNSLTPAARLGWAGDAAAFSEWLTEFEARSRREGLISASRIGLQLADLLRAERGQAASSDFGVSLAPLLLVGFDRILEVQKAVLQAWGSWQRDEADKVDEAGEASGSRHFFAARDAAAELQSCVAWLRGRIAADPEARLIVVVPGLQERRGELERALLERSSTGEPALDFEFSLGVPLGRTGVSRGAILILRWLSESLAEAEVDWLLTSGFCAASANEELALAATMRNIRRRGQERPEWTLEDFISPTRRDLTPPAEWVRRMTAAQKMLSRAPKQQSPLDWVALAMRLLETAGWPGFRPLGSVAFQARERLEKVLEECGSLGFDGSQMEWAEFVATVSGAVSGTIFATESRDATIQITEPLESAGQLADGIWFLGADEENWPGRGQPHPLLPIGLQRDAEMPHASPLADWKLAQEATTRLLASADEVIFSYPRHSGEAEARPSRLTVQHLGAAADVPADLMTQAAGPKIPLTQVFEDTSRIHFPHLVMGGGAGTLTRQSHCPFQAFATARLGAEDSQPAETGLNAKQRGQLLHAVMHRVWGGRKSGGLSSLDELNGVPDLQEFVWKIVHAAVAESFDSGRASLPDRFPARLIELEERRLTELVTEWLEYERTRLQFKVSRTEERSSVSIAGLKVQLRLDRIDELGDGSLLVIDYKTGNVGPGAWAGDRPDDVQLPLYATLAMDEESRPLEGLVFARVRPGDMEFSGRVRNASASLRAGLTARNGLVKEPLTEQQLEDWRGIIERLGEAFVAGDAEVNPKDGAKTCDSCHLHAVCRVYENQPLDFVIDGDDESDSDGGGDA